MSNGSKIKMSPFTPPAALLGIPEKLEKSNVSVVPASS